MKDINYYMFVVVIGIVLLTGICSAADFSADMVTSSREGTFRAKIYVSEDKSRTEIEGTATIARMDKKIVWVLIPGQKMYIEQPLDIQTAASTREKIEGEISRSVEGNDTVNGMATTKYRVVFESQGMQESVFQWIDTVYHIPVKTADIDGKWSNEFKNIKTGAQDPALFEVPAGYSKMSFDMPMGRIEG